MQQQQPGYPQYAQGAYPHPQQPGYPTPQPGYPMQPQQQAAYPMPPPQYAQQQAPFPAFQQLYPPPQYPILRDPPSTLQKGQCFFIPQSSTRFMMGLGWDTGSRRDIDLDSYIFMVTDKGDCYDEVYYGDKLSKDSQRDPAVHLLKDNRSGAGEGDDEQIMIDLARLEPRVMQLFFVVKIHSGAKNFREVSREYVRIADHSQNREISRFNIDADYTVQDAKAVWFCSIYRDRPGSQQWIFRGVGEATTKETRFSDYYDRHISMIGGKSHYSKKKK